MESLVHRISLEYRWTNPFQDKRKVANHEDEKSCVNFTDLEVDLQRPIEIQGNLGESPFKRLYYQTCGWCSCLCHSDFNLGPSWLHYVAMKIFFCEVGLRGWVTFTAAVNLKSPTYEIFFWLYGERVTPAAAVLWLRAVLLTHSGT